MTPISVYRLLISVEEFYLILLLIELDAANKKYRKI